MMFMMATAEVATPFPEGELGKKGVFGSAVPLNFLSQ